MNYFDASLIGLTATPDKRTFGFFNLYGSDSPPLAAQSRLQICGLWT